MSSKRPLSDIPGAPDPNQGAFWEVTFNKGETTIHEPEEGVYHWVPEETSEAGAVPIEAVQARIARKALNTQNRRKAHKGKHSARSADGTYSENVSEGRFLPTHAGGPVMTRTLGPSQTLAGILDAKRAVFDAQNPQLTGMGEQDAERPSDMFQVDWRAVIQAQQVEYGLVTDEKLRKLLLDERAGFLPSTHSEKTFALNALEPTERAVLRHEAVMSGLHERGDYFESAEQDIEALAWLGEIGLNDSLSSPDMILKDALDRANPAEAEKAFRAFLALVRYEDVLRMLQGKEKFSFRPLATREDRREQPEDGKNKKVYDAYTAAFTLKADSPLIAQQYEAIKTHVRERYATMTVREAAELIPAVLVNQQKRRLFLKGQLQQFEGSYKAIANRYLS